jgi:CRISP-associated protein Cas1
MSVVYITQQGAVLGKEGERLIVTHDGETLLDQPLLHVSQVVLFGNVTVTAPAASLLFKRRIEVVFLSQRGRYKGRLQPEYSQTVDLRKQQYLQAEEPSFCLALARALVQGKIRNTLLFCLRQRQRPVGLENSVERLKRLGRQVETAADLEVLRGYEGTASALYFSLYRQFLKEDFGFARRVKHPPTDPVNVLLSLGYTLLFNNVYAMVNLVGFDPYQGFYHCDRFGHPALVSDLMEEFRTLVVDSAVLWVINKRLVTWADFNEQEDRLTLGPDGLKRFLKHYEDRLQTRIFHPLANGRVSYLQAIEWQVRLLARVLRREAPTYTSFVADKN